MLGRIFSRKYKIGADHYFPELARPMKRLPKADVGPARRLMESTRDKAWNLRHIYASTLSEVHVDHLEEWCRCEPLSSDPWLIRGMARTVWAWEARTGARASDVTEEGWRLFYQRLAFARRDLLWAAERFPADPTPYAFQITVHMGGGRGTDEIHRLIGEVNERHPAHLAAYRTAVYALTEQWKGSHDQMFAMARSGAEKANWGNDLAAIIPYAHRMREEYYSKFENDHAGADAYAAEYDVIKEIATTFDRNFGSPKYREGPTSFMAWNEFAYWFYLMDDFPRLRSCLEFIKRRYTGVWEGFADPQAVLKDAERKARG